MDHLVKKKCPLQLIPSPECIVLASILTAVTPVGAGNSTCALSESPVDIIQASLLTNRSFRS